MNKGSAKNILAVGVVVVVVAGAAWFKSQRAEQDTADQTQPAENISVVRTDPDAGAPAPIVSFESSGAPDAAEKGSSQPGPEETTGADTLAPGETKTAGAVAAQGSTAEQPGLRPDKTPTAAENVRIPRLVDLGAGKCKQCKALAPILDALREEYKGRLSVEFIDVWKNPKAAEPYKIRLIPTQVLYDKDGKELWRHEGFISKENLKALFAEKVGVK